MNGCHFDDGWIGGTVAVGLWAQHFIRVIDEMEEEEEERANLERSLA